MVPAYLSRPDVVRDSKGGLTGAGRLGRLTPGQRSQLRPILGGGETPVEATTKPTDQNDGKAPASRLAGRLSGRPGGMDGVPGDQKAIFEWVKQAMTAFWDAGLKGQEVPGIGCARQGQRQQGETGETMMVMAPSPCGLDR